MESFYGVFKKRDYSTNDIGFSVLTQKGKKSNVTKNVLFQNRFYIEYDYNSKLLIDKSYETRRFIFFLFGNLYNPSIESASLKYDLEFDTFILEKILGNMANLRGEFVIILFDKSIEALYCIRDQIGVRPLYYADTPKSFHFASELKYLIEIDSKNPEIDEVWIADSISTIKSEKCRTPYTHIKKLLPAGFLKIDKELECNIYWDLRHNSEDNVFDYAEATEVFREKLHNAIQKRVGANLNIAAELSGGLDSSGVTAILYNYVKQSQDSRFYAFIHAFSHESLGKYFPYNDERKYSKPLAEHLGIKNLVFCDADNYGILATLKNSILLQSGPVQQGYNIFSDALYERASQEKIDLLFSGFGGDEGVSSEARVFFKELVVNNNWDLYKREYFLKSNLDGRGRMRTLLNFYLNRYFGNSKRIMKSIFKSQDLNIVRLENLGIDKDFGTKIEIEKRFNFMTQDNIEPNVQKRQYRWTLSNHVSQRMEYSHIAANARNIEYTYPLWDVDLIEFYYQLPSHFKFRNGYGRSIFRESLIGILPDWIRLRNDKLSSSIPTVHQRLVKDYDGIRELFTSSKELNKWHYLDYDKMMKWQDRIMTRTLKDNIPTNQGAFINSLQVLILQEMQRNGEFKSGIRC